jgi:outer membrane protein assembly factor BamB
MIQWVQTIGVGVIALAATNLGGAGPEPEGAKEVIGAWASWRGPGGQGYSDDTRVPLTWAENKNVLWKTPLPGRGNSSPIIWGDHLFLTAASSDGKERYLLCFRTSDGTLRWQHKVADDPEPGKTHGWNGYASPSCTTDGSRVYAFFGTPGLFCYDFDGRAVWKQRFGVFTSEAGWGVAASPFLYKDLVIQNCDNDGPAALPPGRQAGDAAPMALIALDKVTGKERWRAARNQGRSFSTPLLVSGPQGSTQLVMNGPLGVWAYDPDRGTELWHCARVDPSGQDQARFGEPLPVFNRDYLVAASGRRGPMQALRLGGSGDISRTNVRWQVIRKGHRDVASPILWDDLLYIADNKGFLTCYELNTGQELFNERLGSNFLASPVAVQGKLLFVADEGVTTVIEPGRTLKIAGRNKLGEGRTLDFTGSPAIVDGRLFLRCQSHLYCIGEKR